MEINTERMGDTVVARISGRLEGGPSALDLQEKLSAATAPGDRAMVMDCSDIAYISSSGLRVFVIVTQENEAAGIRTAACNMILPIRNVFEISGMDQIITVADTLEEALEEVLEEARE